MHIEYRSFVSYIEKIHLLFLAVLTSVVLLFIMQKLISIAQPELKIVAPTKFENFIYEKKIEKTTFIKPTTRPIETVKPPVAKIKIETDNAITSTIDDSVYEVVPTTDMLATFVPSNKGIRINPVTPTYPQSAVRRNLCGWAIVQYNITTSGGVSGVAVIESSNKIFEKSALQAVSKYKHKPAMSGGKPVEVIGLQTKISYELETGCN